MNIKRKIKRLFKLLNEPEMKVLPGHLAFFMMLSIIPIITLIVSVASIFKVPITLLISAVEDILPSGISEILLPIINGEGLTLTISISMIFVFILASNGTHSIIVASNAMYGIKHSNYVNRRIKALILIILLVALVIFNLIVIGFGNDIVNWIMSIEFLKSMKSIVYQIFILLKWPFALLFIFFLVKLIYTIAPDSNVPSHYTNKGALFTTLFWILSTVLYSFYVTNLTNYNLFYGSLTNIIVMMIWLYIISYILIFGMAINANNYKTDMKKLEQENKTE